MSCAKSFFMMGNFGCVRNNHKTHKCLFIYFVFEQSVDQFYCSPQQTAKMNPLEGKNP